MNSSWTSLCLSMALILVSASQSWAQMVPVDKALNAPPKEYWNDPDFTGVNKDLADKDGDGDLDADDGWSLGGANTTYHAGTSSVALGAYNALAPNYLQQTVANEAVAKNQKTVVVAVTGQVLPSGNLSIKTITTGETVSASMGAGNWGTSYVVMKLKHQPSQETIKLQQTGTGSAVLDTVEIRTKCQERSKENSKQGAPQARHSNSSQVNYDPTTQTLSFGDAGLDMLNLTGTNIMDPAFAADPILGAVFSLTGFTLSDQEGGGYYFEDGTLTIAKDGFTFLQAEIPWLYVDDEATATFGDNVYGELGAIMADFSQGSAWLEEFANRQRTQIDWAEFRACTAAALEPAIAAGVPLQTVASVDLAFCTPEPASLILMALSGFAVFRRSRIPL